MKKHEPCHARKANSVWHPEHKIKRPIWLADRISQKSTKWYQLDLSDQMLYNAMKDIHTELQ